MDEEIGLVEFIEKIKEDLKNAQQDSKVFLIDKVELEIQVTASRKQKLDGEAKGKLDINVVPLPFNIGKIGEVGVSGKLSGELAKQDVHTVKVSLTLAALNKEFMEMLPPEKQTEAKENTERLAWLGGDSSQQEDFQ